MHCVDHRRPAAALSLLLAMTLLAPLAAAEGAVAQGDVEESPATGSTPTAADDDMLRARQRFEQGVIAYEEGQFEEAIVAWHEAYELSEAPLLLFNIANAHERLGDLEQALAYLRRYREHADAEEREILQRRMANMERRLEEQRQAAAAAAAQPAAEPAPTPAPQPAVAAPAEAERAGIGTKGVLQIAFGTLTVAGATTAIILGSRASSLRDDLSDLCTPEGICPTLARNVRSDEKSAALGADLSIGLAAASAVAFTAVTLFMTYPGRAERDAGTRSSAWRMQPQVGPGRAGLTVGRGW